MISGQRMELQELVSNGKKHAPNKLAPDSKSFDNLAIVLTPPEANSENDVVISANSEEKRLSQNCLGGHENELFPGSPTKLLRKHANENNEFTKETSATTGTESRCSIVSSLTPKRTPYDWKRELNTTLQKNWLRLQNRRLLSALFLVTLYCVAFIVVLYTEDKIHSNAVSIVLFLTLGYSVLTFAGLCFLVPICFEDLRLQRVLQTFSVISGLVLPTSVWLTIFLWFPNIPPMGHTGLGTILNLVLINYTMLLLPAVFSFVLSFFIAVVHTVLIPVIGFGLSSEVTPLPVVATTLTLLGVNILGIYHSYCLQAHKRSVIVDLREAVEKRTVVEYEKEREEQLLLSIIPPYLAEQVKKFIVDRASTYRGKSASEVDPPKIFHDFHVTPHENVSILFADIVGFTQMTAELTVPQLVKSLNELFSKFDELAQEFQCMRIKILGDCYYCVSGMPVSRPQHADNCVRMGLAMIEAIKLVREAVKVDINMRIGVHSGMVLAGLLGLKKWQFDIWSDDVTLANHMEAAGKSGMVHITKTTLELLSGSYIVQPAGKVNDEYITEWGMETYFIVPQKSTPKTRCISTASAPGHVEGTVLPRVRSGIGLSSLSASESESNGLCHRGTPGKSAKMAEFWGARNPFADFAQNKTSDEIRMASIVAIEGEYENFRNQSNTVLNPYLLRFRDRNLEDQFCAVTSPAFELQMLTMLVLFGLVLVIELIAITGSALVLSPLITTECLLAAFLLTHCVQNWKVQSICKWPIIKTSRLSARQRCLTKTILAVLALLLSTGTVIPMLAMIVVSTLYCLRNFVRVLLLALATALYLAVFLTSFRPSTQQITYNTNYSIIRESVDEDQTPLQFRIRACLHVSFLFLLLLILNWLFELERRVDWACLASFKGEQNDVEKMQDINTLLLRNILPDHVSTHFLAACANAGEELYHEYHENVCVMFASIPNFQDFWSQWDMSRKLECLRLLNEIFCEFDKLLLKPKFSNVEKIKTVSSTYMAVAGLQPTYGVKKRETQRYAGSMLEFALAMINLLDRLNRDAFQNFKLRIGMCYGPAIAGVIGAQKPQYDIWGTTVNLASRMDSHGEMGKIQVTANTAEALIMCGYECESRGSIKIKGVKEIMETFYVKINNSV